MVIGTLINTRGLTELIVLNIALKVGAISSILFTALVVMAIITTLMTGPMLKLLDPRNEYGTKIEDELAGAASRPPASIPACRWRSARSSSPRTPTPRSSA